MKNQLVEDLYEQFQQLKRDSEDGKLYHQLWEVQNQDLETFRLALDGLRAENKDLKRLLLKPQRCSLCQAAVELSQ